MYYSIKNRKNLPFWENILTEKRKRSEKSLTKRKSICYHIAKASAKRRLQKMDGLSNRRSESLR